MTEKKFIELANKILYVKQSARTPFGGKKSELKGLKKLYKAINYSQCCKSDSEQLVCGCGKNKPVKREPAYLHCDWCGSITIETK